MPLILNTEIMFAANRCRHAARGVFRYPYHPTCRVLNFWLPTVGCWKIQEFVCFTLKFACFHQNRQILSHIQCNLTRKCYFLTNHRHGFRNSRVLICKINTPLHAAVKVIHHIDSVLPMSKFTLNVSMGATPWWVSSENVKNISN